MISPACLLVRPAAFGYHAEAASTNAYAHDAHEPIETIARRARDEADALSSALRGAGVRTLVLGEHDKPGHPCPDAVFPNNWMSVHEVNAERVLVLYPMRDRERRRERWGDMGERLGEAGLRIDRVLDYTHHEQRGRFVEGTGSLVFDSARRVCFIARSGRTDPDLASDIARELACEPVVFDAIDRDGTPVYHTNVLLSVAPSFAICCLDRIVGDADRGRVRAHLCAGGRTLVEITPEQMDRFCANVLALPGAGERPVLAMSQTAHDAFTVEQRATLSSHALLLPVPVPTIERIGGGSVRCMIAALRNTPSG